MEISHSLIDEVKVRVFEDFGIVDTCEYFGDSFASLFFPLLQHLDVFLYLYAHCNCYEILERVIQHTN